MDLENNENGWIVGQDDKWGGISKVVAEKNSEYHKRNEKDWIGQVEWGNGLL